MFRRSIPSTFNAASALIGGSKTKAEIQAGIELVRNKDEITLVVDGFAVGSYSQFHDGEGRLEEITLTPGANRTSKIRGILNAMLSATASSITAVSEAGLERTKAKFDALLEMARTDEQRKAVIEMREAALEGGWMLYENGKQAVPFASGATVEVLL